MTDTATVYTDAQINAVYNPCLPITFSFDDDVSVDTQSDPESVPMDYHCDCRYCDVYIPRILPDCFIVTYHRLTDEAFFNKFMEINNCIGVAIVDNERVEAVVDSSGDNRVVYKNYTEFVANVDNNECHPFEDLLKSHVSLDDYDSPDLYPYNYHGAHRLYNGIESYESYQRRQ